ncbi:septation protein A [uncultured Cocleimonas sp.]|uniref:septation protein A n=1 Tax=uncultured Cocleimonas sp. TaxID=1051587 RepID=UPI002614AB17|nr:septation protein A [uncultured Cocleimonas sp.]
MKFLIDFFPVVLFFIGYKFFGDLPPQWIEMANQLPFVSISPDEPKDAIYFATVLIILSTIVQNIVHRLVFKKLEKMHLISLAILIAFGTLTLAFKDPLFIKWKVSIFNWVFALVIIGSQFVGSKSLIERMMAQAIDVPKLIWKRVNLSWGVFFALVGFVNIYVAYNYSEDTWVDFKMFGVLGMTFVFMIAQGVYLAKHATPDDVPNDDTKEEAIEDDAQANDALANDVLSDKIQKTD